MEENLPRDRHYLTYQGSVRTPWEVRDRYYQIYEQQKKEATPRSAEIDVCKPSGGNSSDRKGVENARTRRRLALILAHLYSGISRKRSPTLPRRKAGCLDELCLSYRLALISDGPTLYALRR